MQRSSSLVIATVLGALTTGTAYGGGAVEDAAKAACGCMEPLYAQLQALQDAMRSGDEASMDRLEAQMDQRRDADDCMNRVADEHPELLKGSARQNQVKERMQVLCPPPSMSFGM